MRACTSTRARWASGHPDTPPRMSRLTPAGGDDDRRQNFVTNPRNGPLDTTSYMNRRESSSPSFS